jgi:hypothetical protein
MNKEYKHLLSLLDDENEQSASLAMAELLARDTRTLEPVLRKLQESSNPRLRRRIHQLQSTMILRKRRRTLSRNLSEKKIGMLEGLIQIHLLWYDNDAYDTLKKQWEDLIKESEKYHPKTLEQIAYFMRKKGFTCTNRDELESEYFCLGNVLDEHTGADFMLCAVACMLAAHWGLRVFITQSAETDFILVDRIGNILIPVNDWNYIPYQNKDYAFELWNTQMLLRYAATLLFTCAASSDSFRYVYTIGSCLSGNSADNLDFLPYPYGKDVQ